MKHQGLLLDAYVALTAARDQIAKPRDSKVVPTICRVDDVLLKIQVVVGEGVAYRAAKSEGIT